MGYIIRLLKIPFDAHNCALGFALDVNLDDHFVGIPLDVSVTVGDRYLKVYAGSIPTAHFSFPQDYHKEACRHVSRYFLQP